MRSVLLCAALALNAFCAGGMFTFPLMAPALAVHNKLAPAQLTTIILAGMMSQYPVTVFVGALIDRHGPALCTLLGGLLFVTGFGSFAHEVAGAPGGPPPSRAAFYRLVAAFLFVGLGTVFSYCSALFAASKYFPRHIGLASGTVMALFALSPLFFAGIATRAFVPPAGAGAGLGASDGLLDVPAFATFLALVTGGVALFAALTYKRFPVPALLADDAQVAPAETTPLLAAPDAEHGAVPRPSNKAPHAHPATLRALAQTTDFWLLAVFCVLILGAAEMVISNIGTIVASLTTITITASARSASEAAALQVTLLAGANTAARLVVGPLADFVAPAMALGAQAPPRAHVVSRFAFLAGAAGLLALTFAWVSLGVRSHAQLWALSIGTGLSYSAVFTVIPSLVSALWGLEHIGRNFGLLMYAPFTGTPVFSYLYASVAAAHLAAGETVCRGRGCWQLTFSLGAGTSVLALCISVVLWRRWHGTI